jgi:hypothetical protein
MGKNNSTVSSKQTDDHPPSYTKTPIDLQVERPRIQQSLDDETSITSQSIPQFRWRNDQCRYWLEEVLVELCGTDRGYARQAANNMFAGGFGPRIFNQTPDDWNAELGAEDGESIYALIFAFRHGEGALPKHITYPHYERAIKE